MTDSRPDRRFCAAPMMDWTTPAWRYFARQISRHTFLFTEMVTTGAILHGDRKRFLDFHPVEHPVALQLGGSDPAELAECARLAEEWGYDEVNLNVGCPSDRVQNNMIGACLMGHGERVAQCLKAMQSATRLPVTIKHRLGIDDLDSYAFLRDFVARQADAGIRTFYVHARKAILSGLSPKENREIPPLDHESVYRLKQDFPDLEIIINGGIQDVSEAQHHLRHVDGVMIGRAAYQRPWILHDVDPLLFGTPAPTGDRLEVLDAFLPYVQAEFERGQPVWHSLRHILGLFHGCKGGRVFRRTLSTQGVRQDATPELLGHLRETMAQYSITRTGRLETS